MTFEVLKFDGAGVAPPIVFLHEGLGSARQWRDFPARVAAATGHDAIAYSRRGYGASAPVTLPRPLDYMEQDAREDVPRVLAELGIYRTILFGHSDGASIALLFAAEHPNVDALILEAPHVFVEDRSITSIRAAKESYERGDLREKLARHHEDVDVAFRGWNDAWLDPGFRTWNIEHTLAKITAPILVIQSDDDPYGTRAQVDVITLQAAGTVTPVFVPRCGHAPHRDQPDVVLDAVTAFVSGLGGR